MMLNRGLWVG